MTDKTELYQNEATQFYADSGEKTQMYGSTRSAEHRLEIGQKIELQGQNYTIISIVSEDSGEAVIYGIENEEGKKLALKMYFEFRSSSDEPNPESLRRILEITDSDLLKLHNFGTSEDKFQGKYCFEISDFAEGGDLLAVPNFTEKFNPEFLESKVVSQIFKGIRTLHRNKIFHCDMKPQNVFFRDSERTNLVIGDYGSAKTFDFENGKDSRKTSTVKGTDFYLPPEQARGFISEKNDYYSFGMILLHLTYPEKVCQNSDFSRLSRQKLKEIIEKQFENQPIINYVESKGRINNLIAGLTLSNVSNRWGEQEVRQWLGGENPEIKYRSSGQFSTEKKIEPIDLGDRVIRTENDLIEFIENDSEWYDILIEDRTGRDLFNKWLVSIHNLRTKRDIDKLIKENQQYVIAFIQEAILRFFQPYRPITIKNWAYDFAIAEDLAFESARYFGQVLNNFYANSAFRLYIFKYELALKNCPTQNEAEKVRNILTECHKKLNPEAKSPFPNDKFTNWLGDAVGQLVGKENAELYVHFENVTEDGIYCTISESLTSYFAERGEDLKVEHSEERTFSYPEYYAEKDEKSNLYFSSADMYDMTINHIKNQLITDKPMNFKGFKRFEEELENRNPVIWKTHLLKEVIVIDFTDLKRSSNFSSVSNEGGGQETLYSIDYQLLYPNIYLDKEPVSTTSLMKTSESEHLEFQQLSDSNNWESFDYQAKYQFKEEITTRFSDNAIKLVRNRLQRESLQGILAHTIAFVPFFILDSTVLTGAYGAYDFGGVIFLLLIASMAIPFFLMPNKSRAGALAIFTCIGLSIAFNSLIFLLLSNLGFLIVIGYYVQRYYKFGKYLLKKKA